MCMDFSVHASLRAAYLRVPSTDPTSDGDARRGGQSCRRQWPNNEQPGEARGARFGAGKRKRIKLCQHINHPTSCLGYCSPPSSSRRGTCRGRTETTACRCTDMWMAHRTKVGPSEVEGDGGFDLHCSTPVCLERAPRF